MDATSNPWTDLDPAVAATLRDLRDLLLRWSQRFNLTALSAPEEIDARLIGDALRMLPALDAVVAATAGRQTEAVAVIDVGTGAGFPGLVVKIARPALDVTLLDATGKKIRFVEQAIAELGLPHARALHGRAEELGQQPHHRERYDVVTARAVASLPALLELTLPLLRIGGTALLPKGLDIAEELAAGRAAAAECGGEIAGDEVLPGADGLPQTRLVTVRKLSSTPKRYPRRSGVPAKDPLGRA